MVGVYFRKGHGGEFCDLSESLSRDESGDPDFGRRRGGTEVVAGWFRGLLSKRFTVDESFAEVRWGAGDWRAGAVFRGGLSKCLGAISRYLP